MEQMKYGVMQMALELYKIELSKGDKQVTFSNVYQMLMNEIMSVKPEAVPTKAPAQENDMTSHEDKPTAQEYFNNKRK